MQAPLPDADQPQVRKRSWYWRWPILLALSALLHGLIVTWVSHTLRASSENARLKEQPIEVAIVVPLAPPPARVEPLPVAAAPVRPVRPRLPRPVARPRPEPARAAVAPAPAVAPEAAPALPVPIDPFASLDQPAAAPAPAQAGAGQAAAGGPAGPDAAAADATPAATSTSADTAAAPAPEPKKPALLYGAALMRPPAAGKWSYKVYYGDYQEDRSIAQVHYSLEQEGDRYVLKTEGRAEGLTAWIYSGALLQTSHGRVTDNGMEPERYSEQRGKRAERSTSVDYGKREVAFSSDNRVPLVDGLQDRLSSLMQLGLIARTVPERVAAGQQIDLPEMTSNAIETARYRSDGDSVLETSQGPLHSVHLTRMPSPNSDNPKIEVWLGYDQTMLPVRIRLTDANGRVLDQLLQRAGG